MNFFRQRHVVVAALVAPVLAVIGYYAVDAFVGEKPQAAREGQSYPLVEKPNCRYGSGFCGLKNQDFELKLHTEPLGSGRVLLILESVVPLEGVKVAMVGHADDPISPVDMEATDGEGRDWSLEIARPDPERDRLRVVASANRSLYFGDVATKFTVPEATLNPDRQ